ncbi:MAG: FAD-dependent monooxygenase [Pseudomonadota bacterium]
MKRLDHIEIVGAGPAGLYVAILLKQSFTSASVTIRERNPENAEIGFGVVFSDQALDFLQADDPATHGLITPLMERWQDITVSLEGERVTLDGIGFAAVARRTLLDCLRRRAREVGVELHYESPVLDVPSLSRNADLIIGADGVNSVVRESASSVFQPDIEQCRNHFAWFGADIEFDTLTQTFLSTDHGALNAHHYRYAPGKSTFIVECEPRSFDLLAFADRDEHDSAKICSELFADPLNGTQLQTHQSFWRQFPKLTCAKWTTDNRVLIGDAAHTAHFSIGSGTRLALEDAIALVRAVEQSDTIDSALGEYERARRPIVEKIVAGSIASAAWYDRFTSEMAYPPLEFAKRYLTRSARLDNERLRKVSPKFASTYEEWAGSHP